MLGVGECQLSLPCGISLLPQPFEPWAYRRSVLKYIRSPTLRFRYEQSGVFSRIFFLQTAVETLHSKLFDQILFFAPYDYTSRIMIACQVFFRFLAL